MPTGNGVGRESKIVTIEKLVRFQMKEHSTHLTHPKYRPDIDGLRAIAVLSVVGFHAFPNWVKGGFIGVDIFFVISGFLISIIIFQNLEKGTFSFAEFYARRIKRIFPALLLVLVVCYAFGWYALLADEYKQLGKHIFGGAGFISNFLFWSEAGYFDNAADAKPLLHLWSLGIEEQYYIFWPLLLWAAWKRGFSLFSITTLVLLISYSLNVHKVHTDSVAAFYSPQTRFWELLCGSLLAWLTVYHKNAFSTTRSKFDLHLGKIIYKQASLINSTTLRNLISIFGFLLIAFGINKITKETAFPGTWALLPILGSVLIISAGATAWLNRAVLSNRVLVWFGLISYPLYLWHWPLLSFVRIIDSETPSRNTRIAMVALSIVLAWLTYRMIERPIRFNKNGQARTIVLVVLMTTIGYVGFNTYQRNGLDFRANANLKGYIGDIGHIEFHKYIAGRYYLCSPTQLATEAPTWAGFVRCAQSKDNPNVEIALIGDSHAEHLFPGLAEALPNVNIAYYIKGNPPFIDNPDFSTIYQHVIASKTIRKVVLTMYWAEKIRQVPAGSTLENEILRAADVLIRSGKQVYITDDVSTFPFSPEQCKGKRWLSTKDSTCEIDRTIILNQSQQYLTSVRNAVAKDPRIKLLETLNLLCGDNK